MARGVQLSDAPMPLRDPALRTLAPNGGAAPTRADDELVARVERTFTDLKELYDNTPRRHPGVVVKHHGGAGTYDRGSPTGTAVVEDCDSPTGTAVPWQSDWDGGCLKTVAVQTRRFSGDHAASAAGM